MCRVEEIGEQETNELEEVGNEDVRGEEVPRASREVIYDHVGIGIEIRWGMYGRFPVRRNSVGLRFIIGLGKICLSAQCQTPITQISSPVAPGIESPPAQCVHLHSRSAPAPTCLAWP